MRLYARVDDILENFLYYITNLRSFKIYNKSRIGVQDNIDQIRLQRELKEKVNQYSEIYSKFNHLSHVK